VLGKMSNSLFFVVVVCGREGGSKRGKEEGLGVRRSPPGGPRGEERAREGWTTKK